MMSKLKENIIKLTKKYGVSYSKLERKAGLSKTFISSILHEKARSPNIDAVMKLAMALDMSVDELVGLPPRNVSPNIEIDNEQLFVEVLGFVSDKLKNHTQITNISDTFKVILDIYAYSREQNKMDKKYATYCIETKLLKENK